MGEAETDLYKSPELYRYIITITQEFCIKPASHLFIFKKKQKNAPVHRGH